MKEVVVEIGDCSLLALQAESSKERRLGMRAFSTPRPLLLSLAPLIHTWGCEELDLVWVRGGRVCRVCQARPRRLYGAWAWYCLELPRGQAARLGIGKGSSFSVLEES